MDKTCGSGCSGCTGFTEDPADLSTEAADSCLKQASDCDDADVYCSTDKTCGSGCSGCTGFTEDPADVSTTAADSCTETRTAMSGAAETIIGAAAVGVALIVS